MEGCGVSKERLSEPVMKMGYSVEAVRRELTGNGRLSAREHVAHRSLPASVHHAPQGLRWATQVHHGKPGASVIHNVTCYRTIGWPRSYTPTSGWALDACAFRCV